MEYWWTQPLSRDETLSHNGIVHVHSRTRSVSGMQVMAVRLGLTHVQNQLNVIVRIKPI